MIRGIPAPNELEEPRCHRRRLLHSVALIVRTKLLRPQTHSSRPSSPHFRMQRRAQWRSIEPPRVISYAGYASRVSRHRPSTTLSFGVLRGTDVVVAPSRATSRAGQSSQCEFVVSYDSWKTKEPSMWLMT